MNVHLLLHFVLGRETTNLSCEQGGDYRVHLEVILPVFKLVYACCRARQTERCTKCLGRPSGSPCLGVRDYRVLWKLAATQMIHLRSCRVLFSVLADLIAGLDRHNVS